MNEQKKLSKAARMFLIIVGLIADSLKIGLEFFFGIGLALDSFFISPIALVIFTITFMHNGVPMFSGKRGWMGWTNLVVGETPLVNALPNWTMYAWSA